MLRRVRTVFGQLALASVLVASAILVLWQADLLASGDPLVHKVVRGDSLRAIAADYGVTREALAEANALGARPNLYRHQSLTVPAQSTSAPAEEAAAVAASAVAGSRYTVKRGDSLSAIAAANGISVEELAAANNLSTGRPLVRNQTLIIPGNVAGSATPPAPAAEAATVEETTVTDEADKGDDTGEPKTDLLDIVDTAVAAGDFTTLVAAVQAAGLVDALKSEGPLTVFAPTDAAFAALPAETVAALLADPTGDLTQILLYHVVAGKVTAADLSDGLAVTTLQGSEIVFSLTDGAKVNDVNIIATDIETANGVIHVIDAVLLPPASVVTEDATTEDATTENATTENATTEDASDVNATDEAVEEASEGEAVEEEAVAEAGDAATEGTAESALLDLVDTAIEAGDFNTLVTAVSAAGLAEALRSEGPFTVFAPTDAAFESLPMGALNALLLNPEGDLAQILLYHVVAGKILSSDLSDGLTVTTLQGSTLVFSLADGAKVNEATIIAADIEASNGVIHVIDAVLLPAP